MQKINTRAPSRCNRQNSINALAPVVFSIFILIIFSIIFTLKVFLINAVMQNIFSITKLPHFHVYSQKYHYGEHVMK